ncbi:thioredoxin domain-containing protein [Streptomyces sp. NPDC051561]|uniref:thioredoxin domain-containing protein n=1 Tax=Streptomyces sp. NPDC051561 TaxID=3365658 RepID=UPI0037950546
MKTIDEQPQHDDARARRLAERAMRMRFEKRRRRIIVGVIATGSLMVIGGVGYLMRDGGGRGTQALESYWLSVVEKPLVAPSNSSGEDGTIVTIGRPDAKHTLKIYEDPRCPVCAVLEQNIGKRIEGDLNSGKYNIQFIGTTFIDGDYLSKDMSSIGEGEGSKNALSALGAALDVSPQAFMSYKAALYSKRNHPGESQDDFRWDSYLLKIADSVAELRGCLTW